MAVNPPDWFLKRTQPMPKGPAQWPEEFSGKVEPIERFIDNPEVGSLDVDVDIDEHEDIDGYFQGKPSEIKWDYKHFKPQEFASRGNGQVNVKRDLVSSLDVVREQFGLPIRITSGYRDKDHNTSINGASNSRHMHGDAVDINIAGFDDETRTNLMRLLRQEGFTAFGSYTRSPNMLHADKRGVKAKWHHGRGGHPGWFKAGLTGKPALPKKTDEA